MMRALIEELERMEEVDCPSCGANVMMVNVVELVKEVLTPRPITDTEPAGDDMSSVWVNGWDGSDWGCYHRNGDGSWLTEDGHAPGQDAGMPAPTHYLPLPDPPEEPGE